MIQLWISVLIVLLKIRLKIVLFLILVYYGVNIGIHIYRFLCLITGSEFLRMDIYKENYHGEYLGAKNTIPDCVIGPFICLKEWYCPPPKEIYLQNRPEPLLLKPSNSEILGKEWKKKHYNDKKVNTKGFIRTTVFGHQVYWI